MPHRIYVTPQLKGVVDVYTTKTFPKVKQTLLNDVLIFTLALSNAMNAELKNKWKYDTKALNDGIVANNSLKHYLKLYKVDLVKMLEDEFKNANWANLSNANADVINNAMKIIASNYNAKIKANLLDKIEDAFTDDNKRLEAYKGDMENFTSRFAKCCSVVVPRCNQIKYTFANMGNINDAADDIKKELDKMYKSLKEYYDYCSNKYKPHIGYNAIFHDRADCVQKIYTYMDGLIKNLGKFKGLKSDPSIKVPPEDLHI